MPVRTHRRTAAAIGLVLVATACGSDSGSGPDPGSATTAPPQPPTTPEPGENAMVLPGPTGTAADALGTVRLHLVDEGRADPLDPEGGDREIVAQLCHRARQRTVRPARRPSQR